MREPLSGWEWHPVSESLSDEICLIEQLVVVVMNPSVVTTQQNTIICMSNSYACHGLKFMVLNFFFFFYCITSSFATHNQQCTYT